MRRKNQKEEYDNDLRKATFDYISQNFEYNNEIVNSEPKLRSHSILENSTQSISIQIMYNEIMSGLSWLWG